MSDPISDRPIFDQPNISVLIQGDPHKWPPRVATLSDVLGEYPPFLWTAACSPLQPGDGLNKLLNLCRQRSLKHVWSLRELWTWVGIHPQASPGKGTCRSLSGQTNRSCGHHYLGSGLGNLISRRMQEKHEFPKPVSHIILETVAISKLWMTSSLSRENKSGWKLLHVMI